MKSLKETVSEGKVREAYELKVGAGKISHDPAQVALAIELDQVLSSLSSKRLASKSSSLGWLFSKGKPTPKKTKGLYVWGDVGRGKSMLMDMFFELLPNKRKRRCHFNDFMQDAHERIHEEREAFKAGRSKSEDPIPVVGKALANEAAVLCFDEFTVTDIADAMILGRLFKVLFENGVVVIATSNVAPENLYRHGLNRHLFLPFIELVSGHVDVFELGAKTDYRLEKLDKAEVYHHPLGAEVETAMQALWLELTGTSEGKPETLQLKGREFTIPELSSGVARISFEELCNKPRSAEDYIALSRRIHTLFITGVPVMDRQHQNAAKRFILLIDTLYDNHVRIVVSAEAAPEGLYVATSGTEAFEFKRTVSRLHEMQSREYIGAAASIS